MTNLIRANCELLQQGARLLVRHDQASYLAADPASFGAAIGSHFRHVLDHYAAFLKGAAAGRIDYDDRVRDTLVECNRETALRAIESLIVALEQAELADEQGVWVKVSASADGDVLWSESSVARELQFLVSHTVHHYALVAIASRLQGVPPEDAFGVAPSTLKYRRTAGA